MASDPMLVLAGALGGSFVTGILGLIQQRMQTKAQMDRTRELEQSKDRRRHAEMYLEYKVKTLMELHSDFIRMAEFVSGPQNPGMDTTGSVVINERLHDEFFDTLESLKQSQNNALIYTIDKNGTNVSDAVAIFAAIGVELKRSKDGSFVWTELSIPNKHRKNPEQELTSMEINKILDDAVQVLKEEIQAPLQKLEI